MPLRIRFWLTACLLALCWVGCVGTDLVDELPSENARIEINPPTAAVREGETVQFNAVYFDAFGKQKTDVALRWESADPSIATVEANGVVSALQTGQATIWAEAGDVMSDPALVTVVANETVVAQVIVSPASQQLEPGATQSFSAVAQNINGEVLGGLSFTWSSSDPAIASIDAEGLATALQSGTTQITAATEGVASAPVSLTVSGASRRGSFVKRPGTGYEADGHVTVEPDADGRILVKLESDFATSQGPGVHIYLSHNNTVTSSSIDLGALRSFSGADIYATPESVMLDTFDWVIIHCKPFNVTFGYAQLQ